MTGATSCPGVWIQFKWVLTRYPQNTVCSAKKDEDVGKRNERSVHHVLKGAAQGYLTVCGVCIFRHPKYHRPLLVVSFLPRLGKLMPSTR